MSVKTVAVLDYAEIKDGEMKEVSFEDGKVLLSRLGDKIHATSAFCTHYGAPLAKGILTSDGRVVCPWHGACFNVCNGDIEDAPAPKAIHSFRTEIKDGKIHVTANAADTLKKNMERQPTLLATGVNSSGNGVVIVGGGSGTFHAVESLREHGYAGPITILSKEMYTPIDRTKLSKALITDPAKIEWRTAADLKIKYGTNIRLGVEVTSVDLEQKTVTLEGGKDTIPYDKLILASGGIPRRLPIEVEDSQKVDAAAQEGKRMVVIGSSFISMELVVAVNQRKLASIDVIGMEEFPFEAVLGKEIGAALKKFHEGRGVKFHMSSKVDKIIPQEGTPTLPAVSWSMERRSMRFCRYGCWRCPATQFLKGSGIDLEKDGGIKVDKFLKVKSGKDTKNVFAIGDIAVYPQQNGDETRIEHWNVAGNHGRAVGVTISGKPQPFAKTPIFWSAQGQQLRYCGIGAKHEEVIIKGDLDELKFIAYYVTGGKIVAVATMQNDPVVSKASELLRLGLMPSPEEVKTASVDISTASTLRKVEASS
ncbi:flavoprotein [Pholiota molesta]|nr:flavoprotein [Pholiota molesta]